MTNFVSEQRITAGSEDYDLLQKKTNYQPGSCLWNGTKWNASFKMITTINELIVIALTLLLYVSVNYAKMKEII